MEGGGQQSLGSRSVFLLLVALMFFTPLSPLADTVTIDAEANRLDVDLEESELENRKKTWTAPPLKATRGTLYKYIKCVKTASEGCVTDE